MIPNNDDIKGKKTSKFSRNTLDIYKIQEKAYLCLRITLFCFAVYVKKVKWFSTKKKKVCKLLFWFFLPVQGGTLSRRACALEPTFSQHPSDILETKLFPSKVYLKHKRQVFREKEKVYTTINFIFYTIESSFLFALFLFLFVSVFFERQMYPFV